MKIRIRFAKYGAMKFVGHLDMIRYFQKAMRRAEMPMKYSEGYHPHQIMSAAAPLGMGITSDGEYLDIEITEAVSSKEAIDRLNAQMVDGVSILSFKQLPDDAQNAMASLAAATYQVRLKSEGPLPSLQEAEKGILSFYTQAVSIPITKETKTSTRELDLKPHVYEFSVSQESEGLVFFMNLATGSNENIKPDLLMNHYLNSIGFDADSIRLLVHRMDMYTLKDGVRVSLDDIGQNIEDIV